MYRDGVAGTYPGRLVGGNVALDLCNTVSWQFDPGRRVDRIGTPEQFDVWFAAVLLGLGQSPPTREREGGEAPGLSLDAALLVQVHRLREAMSQVLGAHLEGGDASPARAIVLKQWRAALEVAEPGPALPLSLAFTPREPTDVPRFLALAAGDLLRDEAIRRLRRCQGQGCGWFFLDTTRNRSRRWCAPDDCGNRERVRAYGQRRRSATAARPGA